MRVRPESIALGGLLAAAVLFGLWGLPLGIGLSAAGEGTGLSPRFMPQLAAVGMVVALAWGLYRSFVAPQAADGPNGDREGLARIPFGAWLICLAFAVFGFDLAGFYPGGICMAVLLTVLLGERRPWIIVLFPALLLVAIYLLFEFALNVRLPRSGLIPGLPI